MNKRWLCGLLAAVMLVSVLSGLPLRTDAVETMTSSQNMIDVLKKMEGFAARAYWDYTQYTVGYGTRCPDDMLDVYKQGEGGRDITEAEAEALLRGMMVSFENYVNKFAQKYNLTLTQNEFDALVSLTYNCGGSWTRDEDGFLHQAIRSGATGTDLIYAMSLYSKPHADYVVINRRLSEAYMYLEGVYEAYNTKYDGTYPSTYHYVFLDGNGGNVNYAIHGYDGADPQPVRTSFSEIPTGVDSEGNVFVYTFAGWYTASVGGTKVEVLDGSLADRTVLYAQWADPTGQIVTLPKGDSADNLVITVSRKTNIRTGPGTFYAQIGTLEAGSSVTITETYLYNSTLFGKYEGGWISLAYSNYEDVVAALDNVWPKNATVTGNNVNIRNGPSTSGTTVQYQLSAGASIVITEEPYDDGSLKWGKLSDGNWICLSYVTFEPTSGGSTAAPTVTGVTLLNGPTRTDYVQMQDFLDLQGSVLQVHYSDGSASAMTLTNDMITSYSNATLGVSSVTAEYNGYTVTFPVNIIQATITFLNEDGTLLSQAQYSYGDTVVPPEVPPKEANESGAYIFVGWSPALTTCAGDQTYTAVFQFVETTAPETTLPTDPSTDTTDPSTDTTDPSTDTTDPSTDTTDPSTDATDPSTDATDPSTDPTDPSTDSTQPTEPEPTDPEPTDPEPTDPPEWPKTGVLTGTYVNVRVGPGTSYAKAGYQHHTGDVVKIYEVVYDGTTYEWGRLEDGNWICMNYVKLEVTPEPEPEVIPGDLDGNETVDENDAAHLLGYLLFPELYPITGSADLDKNGAVDESDAAYLLGYLLFPDLYPL